MDKVVQLTNEKSEIESKFRESQQDQNRFEAMQARLSQENSLLKQHNEWLNEELGSKSTVLLEDRILVMLTNKHLECFEEIRNRTKAFEV